MNDKVIDLTISIKEECYKPCAEEIDQAVKNIWLKYSEGDVVWMKKVYKDGPLTIFIKKTLKALCSAFIISLLIASIYSAIIAIHNKHYWDLTESIIWFILAIIFIKNSE